MQVVSGGQPEPNKVFSNVQGLRAFAALLVVFEHFGDLKNGIERHYFVGQPSLFKPFGHFGGFGVDLFFVISGFIMIVTTWNAFGKSGSSPKFFLRRCVRIYPPYWLALIPLTLFYVFAPNRFTQFHSFHPNILFSYLLLPQRTQGLLLVAWTLVYEMSFYIVFSVLLLLPRTYVAPALGIWFVLELLLTISFGGSHSAGLSFLGQPFAIEFIFGTIVGLLHIRGGLLRSRILSILCMPPFIAVCASTLFVGPMQTVAERVFIVGLTAALLLYGAVALEANNSARVPGWAVTIGDSSYALYLWHIPVLIALAQMLTKLHPHGLVQHIFLLMAMLAFLLIYAWLIYRYVERPMTKFLNGMLSSKRAGIGVRARLA